MMVLRWRKLPVKVSKGVTSSSGDWTASLAGCKCVMICWLSGYIEGNKMTPLYCTSAIQFSPLRWHYITCQAGTDHVSNVSMTQSAGTKSQPIVYLYTVLILHVLIYCTGPQFFHMDLSNCWSFQMREILLVLLMLISFQVKRTTMMMMRLQWVERVMYIRKWIQVVKTWIRSALGLKTLPYPNFLLYLELTKKHTCMWM